MPGGVAIGRAGLEDLPALLAVQKEAFLSEAVIYQDFNIPPLREPPGEIAAEFASKIFLKAELKGEIVGAVRAGLMGRSCMIWKLAVLPGHRQQGIGSALLRACEELFPGADGCELFTGHRSVANIRLYEQLGYARVREQELSPSLTLVYMRKSKEDGIRD
ncbi:MAG: GNAT family N-acetyltransferase [Verrucomicrobiales bacterium]|jgi:ribosomal protein S18 acetylase RimI-like enzyme|nr:GNAT family N-acetyltransferase [Verrucomicrobiales bacterium]